MCRIPDKGVQCRPVFIPPTAMKHHLLSLEHNLPIIKWAGSLWPLRNLCPDADQPFNKYIADSLVLCSI